MKWILALLAFPLAVQAADVSPKNAWNPSWQNPSDGFDVTRKALGAGSPSPKEAVGIDRAAPVADGLYHVPGAMPGFPTAATLWPRVVPVECNKNNGKVVCGGYDVNLSQGRGEYIYIQPSVSEKPTALEPPQQLISTQPIPEPVIIKKFKKKKKVVKKKTIVPLQCK